MADTAEPGRQDAHPSQRSALGVDENVPSSQWLQTRSLTALPESVTKRPAAHASHAVQCSAPSAEEKRPVAHGLHCCAEWCVPTTATKEPAPHASSRSQCCWLRSALQKEGRGQRGCR